MQLMWILKLFASHEGVARSVPNFRTEPHQSRKGVSLLLLLLNQPEAMRLLAAVGGKVLGFDLRSEKVLLQEGSSWALGRNDG